MNDNHKPRLIVLGGGFAGLQLIENIKKDQFDILLIDQLNHHQFQPLFYQVATSQIEPSSISFPFRKIFQDRKDVRIRLTKAISIDPESKVVVTGIGDFEFDFLVIATGCKTNYFGNKNIKKYTYGLKSTYQAITIRNSILENFEKILYVDDEEKESLMNIVVVGGGPTGVELAGAFAEIKRDILPKDFFRIDFSKMNIILLEGSPNTLNNMSDMSRKASTDYLEDLGVIIKTGVYVTDYDGTTLKLNNDETLNSKHVIWAAGVTGNIIKGFDPENITNTNRYKVDRVNRINGYPHIFAIGDISCMETTKYSKGHPQVANVAIGQGKLLATNLERIVSGTPLKEYEYKDLGSMATIGRHKAVVELPFIKFKGYFAWFVWMFLHLMLILSVRNKLIIFINWAWNYFSKNSSLRLILKDDEHVQLVKPKKIKA
ncbi:MAG: NAD(P)/FAD-dependent oxidoreductase [Saprospiraceae bacterium]|jgi:NADH dehydrogenase|nr:NAD(P)/FAD-dependent oxidoreductase [Saprospiraceae bacterium]